MKVLIFIALKVVEFLGIIVAPYWLGRLVRPFICEWRPGGGWEACPYWLCGFMIIVAVSLIIWILAMNWIWATNIYKELRS